MNPYQLPISKGGIEKVEAMLYEYKTLDEVIEVMEMMLEDEEAKGEDEKVNYLAWEIRAIKRRKETIRVATRYLTKRQKQLIELWYTQEKPARECANEMHISKTTFYKEKKDIINNIAEWLAVI